MYIVDFPKKLNRQAKKQAALPVLPAAVYYSKLRNFSLTCIKA